MFVLALHGSASETRRGRIRSLRGSACTAKPRRCQRIAQSLRKLAAGEKSSLAVPFTILFQTEQLVVYNPSTWRRATVQASVGSVTRTVADKELGTVSAVGPTSLLSRAYVRKKHVTDKSIETRPRESKSRSRRQCPCVTPDATATRAFLNQSSLPRYLTLTNN